MAFASQTVGTGRPIVFRGAHVQVVPDASTIIPIPLGADGIIMSTGAAGIRMKLDGTAPTAALGILIITPSHPYVLDFGPGQKEIRVINVTATQTLDYQFYSVL